MTFEGRHPCVAAAPLPGRNEGDIDEQVEPFQHTSVVHLLPQMALPSDRVKIESPLQHLCCADQLPASGRWRAPESLRAVGS